MDGMMRLCRSGKCAVSAVESVKKIEKVFLCEDQGIFVRERVFCRRKLLSTL